jgi:hypothetical protein
MPATSTTHPPASDNPEPVRPAIEGLLGEWDRAMTDVLADISGVEADLAHPARDAVADLFTDDSPYMADLGTLMSAFMEQDVHQMTPLSDGEVQETSLLRFTAAADDDPDLVDFVFCCYRDVEPTAPGEDPRRDTAVTQGAGEAHRVDGTWLLHRLRQLGVQEATDENPCPDLVTEEADD